MLRPNSRSQTVDEQIVVAQHLHPRVLDELAGAPGREQRRPVRLQGIPDRITAGNSLRIAVLGVSNNIDAHKITEPKLSSAQMAG